MRPGPTSEDKGGASAPPGFLPLEIVHDSKVEDIKRANIAANILRGIPLLESHPAHDIPLHIIGGGPTVEQTIHEADGDIVVCNGSHDWLLNRGVIPEFAAFLDWSDAMAGAVTPNKRVRYLLASQCSPALFDRLSGCDVTIWHTGAADGIVPPGAPTIGGGPTITQRAIPLFYVMGYREFHPHGVDACFGSGDEDHVYPWREVSVSGTAPLTVWYMGREFKTRMDWASHAQEFIRFLDIFDDLAAKGLMDPIDIRVHGEGLIPHIARMRGIHVHSIRN